MKRLLFALMLISSPAFAATQWYNGDGTQPLKGTTLITSIDNASKDYAFDPLDRLLAGYRSGNVVTYNSASDLVVTAGEVVVADSGDTIHLMLRNTSNTTVNWTNIDTGAEAPSTTYYVYAVGASSSATAITYKISTSSTAPSGVTYYKKLGSFYNDSSSNIITVSNLINDKRLGSSTSKTIGATYQAATDGFVFLAGSSSNPCRGQSIVLYSDSASTPTTVVGAVYAGTDQGSGGQMSYAVKQGDYYKGTWSSSGMDSCSSAGMWFVPLN